MDQSHESFYDLPVIHEYPDPEDYAPNAMYAWEGIHHSYVPPELTDRFSKFWRDEEQHGQSKNDNDDFRADGNGSYQPRNDATVDPDYQVSDAGTIDDENLSDEAAEDDSLESGSGLASERPDLIVNDANLRSKRRKSRPRGFGRGGRGGKRGIRKALEPTLEFKTLLSRATLAFIDQSYEEAEDLTLRALQLNPEIFSAYNLLSEIHTARGDYEKALSAAYNGAHTQPRDPEMWSRVARMILKGENDNRDSAIQDAIYCYSRIINLDSGNIEARYQRAALYCELGYKGKVAKDYEQLLKQLPHDTAVLRHLAKSHMALGKPDRALEYYKESISHYQAVEPNQVTSFTWSDVNIIAELFEVLQRYDEGLAELKRLARWLLGRRLEYYWDEYKQDDREWDNDDQPRRIEVSEFVQDTYDALSYGDGLPLELRVKMGIFRLRSPYGDLEEAINHFEWLDPEEFQHGAKLYDYPDLFREAGNNLRLTRHFHEAIRYYEPLQRTTEYGDVSYLLEIARCYREVGLEAEANECYNTIINIDHENLEARLTLAGFVDGLEASQHNLSELDQPVTVSQHKARKPTKARGLDRSGKAIVPSQRSNNAVAPGPALRKGKQQKDETQEEDVQTLFQRRKSSMGLARKGDAALRVQYMATLESLSDIFRNNKLFYPLDKHHKFYGYSKEARLLTTKPKHEVDDLIMRSQWLYEKEDGGLIVVPNDYYGSHFDVWLDVFLEYALNLAQQGNLRSSYEIIASAFHANVFYHSTESLFRIHVCWFSCALIGNDDETLCNIARWFMKEYQFASDSYRLFSALNRLCDSENSWYNCGPSQKYILRQIKAVDFSLIGEGRRKTLWQEKASYTTKDSHGNLIRADEMDVGLLMLYGHILYAGKSYSYAINYFLRSLAIDPENGTIKLSLALAYLHYALKRQADNRHHIIMQGVAFLIEYYDSRQVMSSASEKQEAEFNVGHAYHLLGLTHLAIPYYERCLGLSPAVAVQNEKTNAQEEDFAQEAAFALSGFWASSGNIRKARGIVESVLIIE